MTLGEKIKYLRKFRGMTQKEFGTAIGLDDNRIAQYETNYRVPKRDLLINMAKALNVDPPLSRITMALKKRFFIPFSGWRRIFQTR